MSRRDGRIDLGSGVWMRYVSWAPERALNPQYAHLPDEERAGVIVGHLHEDGAECEGYASFDTPSNRETERPTWTVEQEEPLTLSPSIHMDPAKGGCGLHGYIQGGQWIGA